MIPALPITELFIHTPDIDAVDLWEKSWRTSANFLLLGSPGVYCFYDGDTGEILYIGSSGSRSSRPSEAGMACRLRKYYLPWNDNSRKASSSHVNIILAHTNGRKILVRCWIVASHADALKYEYEAIAKHRPTFNVHAASAVLTKEEKAARSKQRTYKRTLKRKANSHKLYAN